MFGKQKLFKKGVRVVKRETLGIAVTVMDDYTKRRINYVKKTTILI